MTERSMQVYEQWANDPFFDEATHAELAAIKDDPVEIEERFYQDLKFGTGGIRGILGAGTNRMNIYVITQASEAFARYLNTLGEEAKKRGIAISYDSRNGSTEFADRAAEIFATHGYKVYLSDELRPTPMLSFMVRELNCIGGVMVTASHNPAEYNGYKAYGEDGGQLPPEAASFVMAEMEKIQDLTELSWMSKAEAVEQGLIEIVGPDIDKIYTEYLLGLSLNPEAIKRNADLGIVYTPLHGTGNKPVNRILDAVGFTNVMTVPEQAEPDGNFSTVEKPNPEQRAALQMAIDLASKNEATLVIATDPDGDRMGAAVRVEDGSYAVLTGNQIGVLLMDYILSQKQDEVELDDSFFCVSTIVSSRLGKVICDHYGVSYHETLTGFKFIAEVVKNYDEEGDGTFLFGYEESYGYLAGRKVRDKDAVVTCMLFCEMAAVAHEQGKTVKDLLDELYAKYGFGSEKTVSLVLEGLAGSRKIAAVTSHMRKELDTIEFPGFETQVIRDYDQLKRYDLTSGESTSIESDPSNVLLYELDGLDWCCVRPSGTEPLLKIYCGCYGEDEAEVLARTEKLSDTFVTTIRKLLDQMD